MKKILLMLLTIIAIIMLITQIITGCTNIIKNDKNEPTAFDTNNTMVNDMESTTDSINKHITDSDYEIIQTYLDVLQNKTNFKVGQYINPKGITNPDFVFQERFVNLTDYLHEVTNETTYEITDFIVIDMNGDGIKDIVLIIDAPIIMETLKLVLIYEDGTIYISNVFTYHNMFDIKKDGTFFSSFGSLVTPGHWNILRLLFSSGIFTTELVEESPNYYEFHSEFCEFVESRSQKENAECFPFSTETIANDLIAAWNLN